jgi:hypothetical protein
MLKNNKFQKEWHSATKPFKKLLWVIFAFLDPDPHTNCGSESGSSQQK